MKNNYDKMTIELNRIEVCDLLIACTCASYQSNDAGKKWRRLHDILKEQLRKFDEEE